MEADLIKFSKFYILQIGTTNIYIYGELSTKDGYITNDIMYDNDTIYLVSSFEIQYKVSNMQKIREKIRLYSRKIYRVLLVGDHGVGKTSFVQKCLTGSFDSKYYTTIGINRKQVIMDNCTFDIFDISGKTGIIYQNNLEADCAIIMFDSNKHNTIDQWYDAVKKINADIPITLCKTKCDQNITLEHESKYINYHQISDNPMLVLNALATYLK